MQSWNLTTRLLAGLLVIGLGVGAAPAFAQYIVTPILVDGDPNPDAMGIVDNVTKPNVTAAGVVAFEGDDDGTALGEEFIYVGGAIVIRDGVAVPGTGTELSVIDLFQTTRHVNAAGDVVFTGSLVSPADTILMLNGSKVLRDLEAAPGIPGRVFNDFSECGITDAGDIYVEVDLDGTTTDDEVIYFIPAGGSPVPLAMNAFSIFRESSLIIGGPLDGFTWESPAFDSMNTNAAGTFIVDGNLDDVGGVTTSTDDVIIRKQVGMDYELLLRAGDLLNTPLTGMAAFNLSTDTSLANANNDWAIYGTLAGVATANDSVVIAGIASVGGGAPMVLAQEGEDISALTGIPDTTLGTIAGVSINSNGKVLFLASVNDVSPNLAPYDEALFLWEAGSYTMVLTDNVPIPARPGEDLTDITTANLVLNDQDRIFFEGITSLGTAIDGIFEALLPAVFPVTGLTCVQNGNAIDATWTPAQTYTGIRVRLNGVVQSPDLPGTATSYTSPPITQNGANLVEIIGLDGVDEAPPAACSVPFLLPADFEACLDFMPFFTVGNTAGNNTSTDTVVVAASLTIRDVIIEVQIDHSSTFLAGIDPLEVTSPLGTTVRLHDGVGSGAELRAYYNDGGRPNGAPFGVNDLMQPQGPGGTDDWTCETSNGNWVFFTMNSSAGVSTYDLERYCVRIYEQVSMLDCCPRPTQLACSNLGACGGPGVNLVWTNNFAYDLLELVRTDGGGSVTIPLAATATSHFDSTVAAGTTYTYTLRYRCQAGGAIQDAVQCSVPVNVTTVPAVQNLVCTPDPCASNHVTLSWTNGATYDSLTLNRAGMFLANVTGLSGYVDTTAASGTATYSLVADCGGNTVSTNCVVSNSPPAVTDLACSPDFCAATVSVSWNTNGVPYSTLTLNRGGVFLADVTGLSSFLDLAPIAGNSTYSVIGMCGPLTAPAANCVVNNVLQGPTSLVCSTTVCDGNVDLAWTNNATYDSIEILVNGVAVNPPPAPTATAAIVGPLLPGPHTIEVLASCGAGSASATCNVTVILAPGGETDCILALEGVQSTGDFGQIDSVSALRDALLANGRTVYITAPPVGTTTTIVANLPCGVDLSTFETLWVMTGTFPDDYRITAAEGDALAALAAAGAGIYFEAGDHWGFAHVTSQLDQRDGVDPTGNADGDDSLLSLNGLNAPIAGLDLSAQVGVTYTQDQTGNDFTDRLAVTGGDAPNVTSAEVIWQQVGLAYNVGVIAVHMDTGVMISSTFEFGGFGGDQDALAGAYLTALGRTGGTPTEQFIRGRCNGDNAVNIADAVFLLGFLFPGANPPNVLPCPDACDANDDGALNIADVIRLLGSLFGNPTIPLPLPNATSGCDEDPTTDALSCPVVPPNC